MSENLEDKLAMLQAQALIHRVAGKPTLGISQWISQRMKDAAIRARTTLDKLRSAS